MTLSDDVEKAKSAIDELKALRINVEHVAESSILRQSWEDIEDRLALTLQHLEEESYEYHLSPTKENKENKEKRELILKRLLREFDICTMDLQPLQNKKLGVNALYDGVKTFGTFLREYRECRKEKLSVVIERVQKNPKINTFLPTDSDWYRQVEEGEKLVELISIPALAIAYDIEVSLLQALAASPEANIIHLSSKEDFVGIPLLKPGVKWTSHQVPRAKLAGSTTVVVKITISKNGESLLHCHPGEEIAIVFKGKIKVKFPEMTGWLKSMLLSEGEILHFDSNILHQFVYAQGTNSDPNSNAEIIAIRILK